MKSWIFILIAALIAYGFLYPFHFTVPGSETAALVKLFSAWSPLTSRMHAPGHIALFVPLGFAGMFAVAVRAGLPLRIAAITVVSFVLALALQAAQIYVPERTASLGAVIWNMAGAAIGMVVGMLAGGHSRGTWQQWVAEVALPLGLIAPWLTAELLPFVSSLGAQSLTISLQTLLHPTLAPEQLVFHAAGALIAGRALAAALGETQSVRWLFALAGALAVGKMFIATPTPDVSALSGLALGCAGWWLLTRWHEPPRSTTLLLLLLGAYAVGALMPFEFRDAPEPFNLVPFAKLLQGSLLVNGTALAANLCLYTGILGVIRLNHMSPVPGSIALAVLVALFEAIQTYLVGHTPDITEPLLVLLAGQMLHVAPLPASRPYTPAGPAPPLGRATSGAAITHCCPPRVSMPSVGAWV